MKPTFTDFPSSSTFDLDYSNYFFYKETPTLWYRVEIWNWQEVIGEREAKEIGSKYHSEIRELNLDDVSFEDVKQALSFVGSLESEASEISPNEVIYALFAAGHGYRECHLDGNNGHKMLRTMQAWINRRLAYVKNDAA